MFKENGKNKYIYEVGEDIGNRMKDVLSGIFKHTNNIGLYSPIKINNLNNELVVSMIVDMFVSEYDLEDESVEIMCVGDIENIIYIREYNTDDSKDIFYSHK